MGRSIVNCYTDTLKMNYYILAISILISYTEACPSTPGIAWMELGDYCYHISKEAMDWDTSQVYCWEKGAYLAEIMSRDEEDLLDTFLIEGTSYWIGLSDLSHEGVYRWEESHQVAEYTNWAPGEPGSDTSQNCIWKAYLEGVVGWHDAACSAYDYDHGFGEQHALCQTAKYINVIVK